MTQDFGNYLRMSDLDSVQPIWFERQVMRSLMLAGWSDVRHVGAAWDGGADIVGHFQNTRWVVQVKAVRGRASVQGVRDLERAGIRYGVKHGLAVARDGWSSSAEEYARVFGSKVSLVSGHDMVRAIDQHYPDFPYRFRELYSFQEEAVSELQLRRLAGARNGLIALATGLGKTVIAAEYSMRSQLDDPDSLILVLAHSQDILRQSERSFWQHVPKWVSTHQINGAERPYRYDGITFATFQTMKKLAF